MENDLFILIGDSLTFGYGISKNENWVYKLQQSLNYNLINKGVNGNTTIDMLIRFSEDVIANNPTLIFIMGGTNDLLSNKSLSSIIKNIELMIKESLSINSKVILGIPPTIIGSDAYKLFSPSSTYDYCENELSKLREELIKLSNKYNLQYWDFYNLTLENMYTDIFNDGIHLNIKGQNLLFNYASNTLTHNHP
ncbi:GDSL-type esterase/lipase family protein [Clostridium gasigenes]|uniref:Lysophospholipase L1 n=1 Tax=Clostridium gasigenes TaxID=94869 RepID=A0A1H0VT62_9CLOT|nr:GDSL-type esterase/lipase family protein [Clostridium gasigenes]MBB6622512.1 GDSL family lipase [Clostridium gasigenes]MBU3088492.1 GDSL family lipase [Clostridium gasigenes]SDP81365.1 Lysophospholipase L1 [Clostridium gasigenes]